MFYMYVDKMVIAIRNGNGLTAHNDVLAEFKYSDYEKPLTEYLREGEINVLH